MSLRFVVAFLAVFAVLVQGEITEEEDVMVLTDDNFEEAVGSNKYVLVEFYAPWCGHCKSLAPEFAKAAGTLKENGDEPKLGKVDATVQTKLAEKYKVQGYPTIKFFKDGIPMDFQGERKAEGIVSWLKKKTGPASTTLETQEAAEKFIAGSDVVVVGHFDADSEEAKAFLSAADSLDDVAFGHITDAAVAEAMKIEGKRVVVFKKFDEGRVDFEGKWDKEEIATFIKAHQLPLVSEFTQESAPKIFGGAITTHNLLFIKKSEENFGKTLEDFKVAAADFKGQVLFIFIDADNEENARVMEFFGLTVADCPDYRIIKMDEDMAKYKPPTKDFSTEAVAAFTKSVVTGEVKRHLNTEEIPDDWDTNAVKVLVGKNFREVAFAADKKVFVEFYAPWCGHCKQLSPIWDKLAEKFADRDDIVIAKMDSTANEVDEIKVTGFPTLKYFPDDKEDSIIDYNGERTLDAMVKFIESDGKEVGVAADDEEELDEIVPRTDSKPNMDTLDPNQPPEPQMTEEMQKQIDDLVKQAKGRNVTEDFKDYTDSLKEKDVNSDQPPKGKIPPIENFAAKTDMATNTSDLLDENHPNNPFQNLTKEEREQKTEEFREELAKINQLFEQEMRKADESEDVDEEDEDQEQEEEEAASADKKDEL